MVSHQQGTKMAATKYVMNKSAVAVSDMLQGLALNNGNLTLYPERKVVLRRQVVRDQVHVVSGGGSGHEPFAAGFVGEGMLSGAVAGEIFTSPPAANIEAALGALCRDSKKGVLAVVPNYTGDVLNFGIACERMRSKGHLVKTIVVGEDCASVDLDRTSLAGRRGMCGIVLVIKIAGAMAAGGNDLDTISDVCQCVAQTMSTLGVCLEPCSIPGNDPMFILESDQIDIGLGIHGEAGIRRTKIVTARDIVGILLDKTFRCLSLDLNTPSSVCIVINNLGTLTQLEMGIVHKEVYDYFKSTKVAILRLYSGHFMTSLNMKGFQLCVLNVIDEKWLGWLDADTNASGWHRNYPPQPTLAQKHEAFIGEIKSFEDVYEEQKTRWSAIQLEEGDMILVQNCLRETAEKISEKTDELNELDQTCGDGDCGSTLSRLAQGVLKCAEQKEYVTSPITLCYFLESWAQNQMGGTSGALYSLFFLSAGAHMLEGGALDWARTFSAGVDGILAYSQARRGDRTMLDVLIECKDSLQRPVMTDSRGKFLITRDTLNKLDENLKQACEETKHMVPRAGRASNVDAKLVNKIDPGAYGAYIWISAIIQQLKKTLPS